ncbi:MAG: Ig-like domain-containing protein [Acidobacteriota bacterium]|nr:Ig-like domain-containing protein [Acidobacteriota bacterium]
MRTFKLWSFVALATPVLLLLAGCGKETAKTTAPVVTSTSPVNGAIAVPVNQVVSATFNQALDPTSVTGTTFTLSSGSGSVGGTVSYAASGSIASFTPSSPLAYNTLYTATITTGIRNTIGNQPAVPYTWSFTTAVQPTVVSTVPANAATGVPASQVVSATFSTAMNPGSINGTTFKVSSAGGAVAGTVTYSGTVATFTPTAPLAYNTLYTGTITTGAVDVAGDPLAANYVWSFTTAIRPAVVSTVPLNGATGVPINQALSATFSKPMNCATLTAASFTVSAAGAPVAGTVACAGSVATFTPAANLATNTVFTATITTAATDTTGISIAANYVWTFRTVPAPTAPTVISTLPTNGATGVPINQAIAATFSVAMNPATINGTTFTVKGPGGTAVAGVVTYLPSGSVATFTPAANLTPTTLYTATITTGATDLAGTALAANYVWTFTTAAAADTTRPTVIATVPLNGATGVALNLAVTATFSKAMNASTISSATFTLAGPGTTAVAGVVTYSLVGNTATFTPNANLVANTLYTATITTGAADLSGNTLAANYVWTFTTGAAPDTTSPTIVLTVPVNAATGVATDQAVSATFSEAMNPLTITTGTFTLVGPGATAIPATVSYNALTFIATLTPTATLAANTTYTATVTTGATDLAGNPLAPGAVPNPWFFTTGSGPGILPPVLGSAALFGGFGGGAGITNQGTQTVINGNIGTTGVSTLITGFHDNGAGCIYTETPLNIGLVNGTIYTAPPPPTVGCPNEGTAVTQAVAAQAAADALTAYNALVAYPGGQDVSVCPGCGGGLAGELGNRTLVAGVYKAAGGTYAISQGDLTLDAQGNPNAVWIFQASTTLTVGTPTSHRNVLLVNGAQAKNVFWQVGSAATINGILGGGTMVGTIIAQSGISVSTAGVAAVTTVNGRLLVLTGPVTVVNTVVNVPAP